MTQFMLDSASQKHEPPRLSMVGADAEQAGRWLKDNDADVAMPGFMQVTDHILRLS
jgi:hypothetical protein